MVFVFLACNRGHCYTSPILGSTSISHLGNRNRSCGFSHVFVLSTIWYNNYLLMYVLYHIKHNRDTLSTTSSHYITPFITIWLISMFLWFFFLSPQQKRRTEWKFSGIEICFGSSFSDQEWKRWVTHLESYIISILPLFLSVQTVTDLPSAAVNIEL